MILTDSFPSQVNRRSILSRSFTSKGIMAIMLTGFISLLHGETPIPLPKPSSFRGISVGLDQSIWISGSRGVVLRCSQPQSQIQVKSSSNTLGLIWDTVSPAGYNRYDFRDIESKDSNTAIIMSVSDSARILKTNDGGKHWKAVYQNFSPHVFLDAIAMDWKSGIGLAIGDPQTLEELHIGDLNSIRRFQGDKPSKNEEKNYTKNDLIINPQPEINTHKTVFVSPRYYLMLITWDTGNTWHRIPKCKSLIPQDSLASFFAGSGTSLQILSCEVKTFKNKQLKSFNILVGMAGGGENPTFRVLKLIGEKSVMDTKQELLQDPTSIQHKSTYPIQMHIDSRDFLLSMGKGAGWGAYGSYIHQNKIYWVGGNYLFPNHGDSTVNEFSITSIKKSFQKQQNLNINPVVGSTSGYKSSICHCQDAKSSVLFTAGINGLDYSINGGGNWMPTDNFFTHIDRSVSCPTSLHKINTVKCTPHGLIVVGSNGYVQFFPTQ